MSDIVKLLRVEAACTEELHPGDSDILVMRQAADEIERLRKAITAAHKTFAAESDAFAQTVARLRMALEKCGSAYISEPCTMLRGHELLAIEFRRRMDIAHDALEPK